MFRMRVVAVLKGLISATGGSAGFLASRDRDFRLPSWCDGDAVVVEVDVRSDLAALRGGDVEP
jgi:hypothetical protein